MLNLLPCLMHFPLTAYSRLFGVIDDDENKISCDDALIHSEDPPHSSFTNEKPALCLDHKKKEISLGDNTATLDATIDPTIGQTVDTTIDLNICNPVAVNPILDLTVLTILTVLIYVFAILYYF